MPPPHLQSGIRNQMRAWQTQYGIEKEEELGQFFGWRPGEQTSSDSNTLDQRDSEDSVANNTSLEDLDPDHHLLRPGDLIEMANTSPNADPTIAVYVRRLQSGTRTLQLFTSQGKYLLARDYDVAFTVPNFLERKYIDALVPHLPIGDMSGFKEEGILYDVNVPREVSGPVVTKLKDFVNDGQDMFRQNVATLDRAHDILASDQDLKFGNLSQLARRLLNVPTDRAPTFTELYAIRLALVRAGSGFAYDRRSHRLTSLVNIRPKGQIELVERVQTWIRDYASDMQFPRRRQSRGFHIIEGFVEKVKTIVRRSRQDRSPTKFGNVGISLRRFQITASQEAVRHETRDKFSQSDQDIIEFFELWTCSTMFEHNPALKSLPPMILKATGLYDDYGLSVHTAMLFLQEIGIFRPWENRILRDEFLLIPASGQSRPLERMAARLSKSSPDEMLVPDRLAHIRKDWGNLVMFCIDGKGAREIDDGISIEKTEEGTWIHVHVANPTSRIEPGSLLEKMARHMTESIYMPDRSYMMLPEWVTRNHFSLRGDRPVMTFSALLDDNGAILKNDITVGTIRRVIYITPAECNIALGFSTTETTGTITVGGAVPVEDLTKTRGLASAENLEAGTKRTLQQMLRHAEKRMEYRVSQGGVNMLETHTDVTMFVRGKSPGLPHERQSREAVKISHGDPVLEMSYTAISEKPNLRNAADASAMVREFMLLAGEIAGRWCAERNIPVFYRSTNTSAVDASQESLPEYHDRVIKPLAARNNGVLDISVLLQYSKTVPSAITTTEPHPHSMIGLDMFVKVTSPLRRYGDMVAHWQIESGLLEEARRGHSLAASASASSSAPPPSSSSSTFKPVFSRDALRTMAISMVSRERKINRSKSNAVQLYACHTLFRAFYFNEAPLPKKFDVLFTIKSDGSAPVSSSSSSKSGSPDTDSLKSGTAIPSAAAGQGSTAPSTGAMTRGFGYLMQYGLKVAVVADKGAGIREGDIWEAEIQEISLSPPICTLKCLRLKKAAVDAEVLLREQQQQQADA